MLHYFRDEYETRIAAGGEAARRESGGNEMSMSEIPLQIDSKAVNATEGMSVLQAARIAGIAA
ncbi:MAG: hypothetical protein A3G81_28905 [Betaproteobacteria bacterium RIFCSPLOWO2_12_FULL_65_14]|nr:MAG: hypothetical protein A3G81_28905 [Betaproteobacteria bacterium RIFCSPLOWO2_12_FULL_65_14]